MGHNESSGLFEVLPDYAKQTLSFGRRRFRVQGFCSKPSALAQLFRPSGEVKASKLSFEKNQMSMWSFDFGKHRSTVELKVPISQSHPFLKPCLSGRRL